MSLQSRLSRLESAASDADRTIDGVKVYGGPDDATFPDRVIWVYCANAPQDILEAIINDSFIPTWEQQLELDYEFAKPTI